MRCTLSFAVLALAACATSPSGPANVPRPQSPIVSTFEYSSVAETMAALRVRSGLAVTQQGGWTGFQDSAAQTVWTFTPQNHPAHPAVVKRQVVQADGKILIRVTGLCESTKVACDRLMADFDKSNEAIRNYVHREGGSVAQPNAPADAPQAARH
jgi:hypothetical protein